MSTQPQQPHGNFVAFVNKAKEPGDRKPTFDGRLSLPGVEDQHLNFALWAHEYTNPKTGEVKIMFNGQAGPLVAGAEPLEQVASLMNGVSKTGAEFSGLSLSPRQIVIFPNGFKDEAPEKNRPTHWGAYNPGNGEPVVRLSVWMRKDRYGNAMLAGATSYPIPGKSEEQQQDAQPTLQDLVESGAVSQGMPHEGKGKGGRGRARA